MKCNLESSILYYKTWLVSYRYQDSVAVYAADRSIRGNATVGRTSVKVQCRPCTQDGQVCYSIFKHIIMYLILLPNH